ncbi:MAG: M1 family metallopeptidase [Blastocatellia bacterium]|nr:M1 family metallopeptidase [Blastocatellia bacterium]
MRCILFFALLCLLLTPCVVGQSKSSPVDKFRQLEEILPTPNEYRTASGAPGHRYWQQRADYSIDAELDDAKQRLIGSETITYYNNSPDTLTYLWVQLDQNHFAKGADAELTRTAPPLDRAPSERGQPMQIESLLPGPNDYGYHITAVRDARGAALPFTIVRTMMRVDLRTPLGAGQNVTFSIDWNFRIVDVKKTRARGGLEYFPGDGNYIYEMAQWFPRMAAYNDVTGWQHKQFLGSGEFTLEFGDYKVRLTTPDDHIVGATGVLQNPEQVLTAAQRDRLKQAETATKPVLIVTPEEARANESHKPAGKKTWIYHAQNVRDFAFASSRKFIWDAQLHKAPGITEGKGTMAMSLYPKEGNPLWERYSTAAIIHTLNVYSRYSFTYPYPVAYSVNGPVGGMEYPMICFNGPRPEPDGTYPARTKYGLISVVIHEVGHNYFPMIVNSDERQWTWMDEGLNTFLQYLSEQEWEPNYPSQRGEPKDIVDYMIADSHDPIMTNSESVIALGPNAYAKPATALNILRETVLGRELFDFAFKTYSERWKFKRPMPADFFRTMEDASGVDLDWFWRGWFYTTEHTDLAIESVKWFNIDTRNPDVEKPLARQQREAEPVTLSAQRNKALPKLTEKDPSLNDFYNAYDPLTVTAQDRAAYQKFLASLDEKNRQLFQAGMNFYQIELKNIGGLVMPVIFAIEYTDGSKEEIRIPAEIWRRNNIEVAKMIVTPKEIKSIALDPHLETADTDLTNNFWPARPVKSRFQIFQERRAMPNPMQEQENKPGAKPPLGSSQRR